MTHTVHMGTDKSGIDWTGHMDPPVDVAHPGGWIELPGEVIEPRARVVGAGPPFRGYLTAAIKPRRRWWPRRNR